MANVDIMFVFREASHWAPLTGKGPLSGRLCEPDMVILDHGGGSVSVDGSRTNGSFVFHGVSHATFPVATTVIQVGAGKKPGFTFRATDGSGGPSVFKLTGAAFQQVATAPNPGSTSATRYPAIQVGLDVPSGFVVVKLGNQGAIQTNVRVMVENAQEEVGLVWPLISNVT